MACEYCYYLPKQSHYPGSVFKMSQKVLTTLTQQMIASQRGNQVDFIWQGGEPTLIGLDFFQEALRLQRQFASSHTVINNALQTNGLTITPAWCRFLRDNNFLVGISLDGPPYLHNPYRHDRVGRSQFDPLMRGIRLLKKHHVDFNILCCVHSKNVEQPLEVYRFLRDKISTQFLQFIPIIQRGLEGNGNETTTITDFSIEADAYGTFLSTIFDEWVQFDVGKVFIQLFDTCLAVWSGHPSPLCNFAEVCGRSLVLEHNGDLYACDHFVDPKHRLGNITEMPIIQLVDSSQQSAFGEAKRETLPQVCLDCDVRYICNGGCPKNRGADGVNLLCAGYKTFFHHIDQSMQIMRDLLINRRPPAEIMQYSHPDQRSQKS